MKFCVMPIRRRVVSDRRSNEFNHPIRIIKGNTFVTAPMKFGEPNIWYPFCRPELGGVVNPSSFV